MGLQINPCHFAAFLPVLHLPVSREELPLELLDPILLEDQLFFILSDH